MKKGLVVALFALLGCVGTANAGMVYQENAEIFTQDFENGLGENEKMTPGFSVFKDASGNMVMGHKANYSNDQNVAYRLTLNLTGWSNVLISFDLSGKTERTYDVLSFYIGPYGVGSFDAVISNVPRSYMISSYDGAISQDTGEVTLSWVFTSDFFISEIGIKLDNVLVTGNGYIESKPNPDEGSIQVPVSLPLLGVMGFGLMGLARRRSVATK